MKDQGINQNSLAFKHCIFFPILVLRAVRRLKKTGLGFMGAMALTLLLSISLGRASAQTDSLEFRAVQVRLEGCWKTKYYRFKYEGERNLGHELKSRVRSSAPIFHLVQKQDGIYFQWIELLGGEHYQKVLWVKKRRLRLENGKGTKVTYRRNKGCGS